MSSIQVKDGPKTGEGKKQKVINLVVLTVILFVACNILVIVVIFLLYAIKKHIQLESYHQSLDKVPEFPSISLERQFRIDRRLYDKKFQRNHIFEILLDDESRLWKRNHFKHETAWRPLFWWHAKETQGSEILVDGQNLMVLDHSGKIHYAKIFKEKRFPKHPEMLKTLSSKFKDFMSKASKYEKLSFDVCREDLTDEEEKLFIDEYHYQEIDPPYWYGGWYYTVPPFDQLSFKLRIKKPPQLQNQQCLTMSHRGVWNGYVKDLKTGEHLRDTSGCTSLYFWDLEKLSMGDPCSPTNLLVALPLPFRKQEMIEASRVFLTSSASCISILLQETQDCSKLKLAYAFFDMDIYGFVPHMLKWKRAKSGWQYCSIDLNDQVQNIDYVWMETMFGMKRKLHIQTQIQSETLEKQFSTFTFVLEEIFPPKFLQIVSHNK